MEATSFCKTCNASKPVHAFELTGTGKPRGECKACRTAKRNTVVCERRKHHDPASVPKPESCKECGRGCPEVDFKWRTDAAAGGWRQPCIACINAKGYTQAFRKRKMEEDAAGFRARQTAMHRDWVERNRDVVAEHRRRRSLFSERKIKDVRTAAKQRGVDFSEDDAEAMREKLCDACHYCGFEPAEGQDALNGLDRVDSAVGYTDVNTVSCCATCNAVKNVMHVDEFIDKVRVIVAHRGLVPLERGAGARLPAFGGHADLRAAPEKDKADLLTLDQKLDIWSAPCYLCGHTPALGIDREDPDGDYTAENARPCCTACNYMKKDLKLDDFLRHVAFIHGRTENWVVGDVGDIPLRICNGVMSQPMSLLDDEGNVIIVFRSKHFFTTIQKNTNVKFTNVARYKMVPTTPRTYRVFSGESGKCRTALANML